MYTGKISLLEEIGAGYEEKIFNLNNKNDENKLKDMDLKIQDLITAELLKTNAEGLDGVERDEGNNNLVLNLVSNLEKKFYNKSKTSDDRFK